MIKNFFLFLVGCLFFAQNAQALCAQNAIELTVRIRQGEVVYDHSLSKNAFYKVSPKPIAPNTLGLTLINLKTAMTGKPYLRQEGKAYCVGVDEIIFEMGYDEIKVFIDKKYPVNSCPYRVVMDHENYHAAVAQEGLSFFKKDIEAALKKATQSIRPEVVYSTTRGEQIMKKHINDVLRKMQPTLRYIDKKLAEKNSAIDTPASYRQSTSLCPAKDW